MAKKSKSSIFMDFVFLVSLSLLFIKLVMENYLTVDEGCVGLFSLVICFSIFKNPAFRKVAMTTVSLILVGIKYSDGRPDVLNANVISILALGVALFGIYVMLGGASGSK